MPRKAGIHRCGREDAAEKPGTYEPDASNAGVYEDTPGPVKEKFPAGSVEACPAAKDMSEKMPRNKKRVVSAMVEKCLDLIFPP